MTDLKVELQRLYSDASKHSAYQNIPDFVSAELNYAETIDNEWRSDRPRLAYLLSVRQPAPRETWVDFGANTGFFVLSLAHNFPNCRFIAVEAHEHHAQFIVRVVKHFGMQNVDVIHRAIGLRELRLLPRADFLLHLNVLHHAGIDFDVDLVPTRGSFPEYATEYLAELRRVVPAMLFQLGSNWGGKKDQALVGVRDDTQKLRTFSTWLHRAGWHAEAVAYASKLESGTIAYKTIDPAVVRRLIGARSGVPNIYDWGWLDNFSGEFYRRPLFVCRGSIVSKAASDRPLVSP